MMSAHTDTHHGSPKLYTLILLTLMVLTTITVFASGVDFGSPTVNVVIAMVIASIKASLVALFFMHLRWDRPLNSIIFVCGLIFLGIFLIFCFIDVDTRKVVVPQTLKVPLPVAAPAPGAKAAPSVQPPEHGVPAPVH
jgi:cytochrome c oxidase subunit 4